ncbi:hypothetical protein BDQ17DRAFT_1336402 [Cyathus striatus]|nr:hypothetical protein BDQ17DRAFT_1336402 [Cyathus striatus]
MAKGIPPPTSCDSLQWNGDGRHLKDWLRQLEMLYEHYGEIGGKKYDPDEGEEYRSASKLERMARKQRLFGDGDFHERKEFKRMFVDEAEKGAEPEKNKDFREKLNTHLRFMDSKVGVDETSPKKRLKEDPNTLKEVVAAVDKLMDTAPIGRVANLYTEIGGKSGSIIKKKVIESALAGSSKDSYDKVQKEIEILQKEMRTLLQSQTVLVQAQSNQYWPPVNNWGPPQNTTYQFQNPMKESEIRQVLPEGKVTLLQNAGGGMEPPVHLLQQMQQYSGWFERQGWSVPLQMQVMNNTCRQGGVKKPILTQIFNKSKEGGAPNTQPSTTTSSCWYSGGRS